MVNISVKQLDQQAVGHKFDVLNIPPFEINFLLSILPENPVHFFIRSLVEIH
jgi:hypothetical protein